MKLYDMIIIMIVGLKCELCDQAIIDSVSSAISFLMNVGLTRCGHHVFDATPCNL